MTTNGFEQDVHAIVIFNLSLYRLLYILRQGPHIHSSRYELHHLLSVTSRMFGRNDSRLDQKWSEDTAAVH